MENQNNPHQLGESGIKHEPIQAVEILDIKEFLQNQASEFELSEYEYLEGKKDKFTLIGKIASIMGDLDRIPKSGYNKQFDYNYVTESDVVGAIRPLMAKNKLVMIPSIRRYKVEEFKGKYNSMQIGTIEIKWTIIDGESAERISFTMIGKGVDNLEKDIYKAITGNKKYALITLFMIDSGDDPERNDTPTDQAPQNDQKPGNNRSNNNSRSNTNANNKKAPQGQNKPNNEPPKEPEVKQPTLGDLLTRWTVLAGKEKSPKETRAEFDVWYKKKLEEKRDHLWMIQALTQKLHEKNQADKKSEEPTDGKTSDPDGQNTEE